MTDSATTAPTAPMSLPARMIGVLVSPSATFANVAAFPRWFGVMAISLLVLAAANYVFLSTPVGQQASLDQQVAQIEGFGQTVTDEMYAQMKGRAGFTAAITAVSILVVSPIFTAILAALLFGVLSGVLGGQASFKQVFAVLAHTSVLSLLQGLCIRFLAPRPRVAATAKGVCPNLEKCMCSYRPPRRPRVFCVRHATPARPCGMTCPSNRSHFR